MSIFQEIPLHQDDSFTYRAPELPERYRAPLTYLHAVEQTVPNDWFTDPIIPDRPELAIRRRLAEFHGYLDHQAWQNATLMLWMFCAGRIRLAVARLLRVFAELLP